MSKNQAKGRGMIFRGATAHHGLLRPFNFTRWCRAANCPSADADLLVVETTSALRSAPRTCRASLGERSLNGVRSRQRRRVLITFGLPRQRTDDSSTNIVRRGAMKKLLRIIAAAMALIVASSPAMAEPKKRSLSDKATHRIKSPRSVPAPLRQWPPNNPTFREYEELKRQGWYKADKA